ncbi:hypothetical protein D3C72_281470 [compost metagenome]
MPLDLTTLSYDDFERVVGALLVRSGFNLLSAAEPGVRGPDFEALTPTGDRLFVEVKHFKRGLPRALLERLKHDLARQREQWPEARGLLVISSDLPESARVELQSSDYEIWSGRDVLARLEEQPDIVAAAVAHIDTSATLAALAAPAKQLSEAPLASQSYAERLAAIPAGKEGWRKFEVWGTELISDIFKPDLGPADRQIRSDDGLDIMDAIYPIRASTGPWSHLRNEFSTRFVVAEYKNFVDPIGQKEVESIAQYLWKSAKRQFGILVSRDEPSESALKQRRRIWLEAEKMVVFLSAHELLQMLAERESGSEPIETLEAQVEGFLQTLTP